MFADECLLFIMAELNQFRNLRQLLTWYENVATQKVNIEKSKFTYMPNIDNYTVAILASFLGMNPVKMHSKYLSLPIVVGQNRMEIIRSLEEKIVRRLQDWKSRMLSWLEEKY